MNDNGDRLLDPNGRERIGRWVGETQQIVGMLPDVLAETERLRARLDASESEAERLRQELLGFRSENQQLRAEREAATEGLGRLMEQIQVLGAELERRFKTSPARRSPFEREPELRVQSV
jgi:chromosome segregation ATPase